MSQFDSSAQKRHPDTRPLANTTPSRNTPSALCDLLPHLVPQWTAPRVTAIYASLVVSLGLGALVPARAAIVREIKSEPGLVYSNEKISSEPWSIHVLKIDRSRKDLTFFSAHARDKVLAVSRLADQARAVPREIGSAVAAINGDFYVRDNPPFSGDPRGLQIVNGELISAPDTVCVWFDTNANPHLDEVKGHFKITWPDGRETPFGLNQQRLPSMSVLYTPTYGPSTRAAGGGRE